FPRESPTLTLAGLRDDLLEPTRADCAGHRRSALAPTGRSECAVDVDAVPDRSGEPVGVSTTHQRRATTLVTSGPVQAARARVRSKNQLESGRIDRCLRRPGDDDATALERLAQRLDDV